MRTTLDIDDDVLSAAKEIADARGTSVGRVISDLARRALTRPAEQGLVMKNGFWLLPARGGVVTSEMVKRLGGEEP